jgi:hypothetical protein
MLGPFKALTTAATFGTRARSPLTLVLGRPESRTPTFSRITVRRGLTDLAEQGDIECRNCMGSFVRQHGPANVEEPESVEPKCLGPGGGIPNC